MRMTSNQSTPSEQLARTLIRAAALFILLTFGATSLLAQVLQTFNASGTFTAPAGVTRVVVDCYGGGGRGSTRSSNGQGGGGGGGAYASSVITVVPGNNYTVNVGTGSSSGTVPGGDSWFISVGTVMAKGGNSVADNVSTGGAGGAAVSCVGPVRLSGGTGANGNSSLSTGGGGGSSASYTGVGVAGALNGGGAAPAGGGNGGGAPTLGGSGSSGAAPGGGGGGAAKWTFSGTGTGGSGANGRVVVSAYTMGTCMTTTSGMNGVADNACSLSAYTSVPLVISGQPTTLGAAPGNARLFNVQLVVTQTFNSDMQITLTSPAGTTRNLVMGRYGSGDNLGNPATCPAALFTLQDGGTALSNTATNNVTGTFAPEQPLAGFSGNPNGVWSLNICDNAAGDFAIIKYVQLNFCTVPQITATSSNTPICAGSTLALTSTATGSPAPGYTWAGTGTYIPNSASANVSVTGATTGTYTVTASSTCGSTTATVPVIVNPRPTATASGGGTVCSDQVLPNVTFTFTGTPPCNFTYSGPGGTTVSGHNSNTYTITNAAAGTYAVTAISDANTCVGTNFGSSATVTVNTAATANAGGPYSICGATAVNITATANRAGTWSGGAGTFASATSTSTTYTPAAGEIGTTVTLTWTTSAQGVCPAVPSNTSLTVNTPATASAGGPYSTCGASAVSITATANRAGTWSGGAGTFASATSTSTTYTPTAGEIGTTVTLTWTTSAQGVCPAAPSNASLTVNTPATASASGPYSTCGATAVSIAATANRAGTWSGGAGTFAAATSTSTTYTPTAGEIGTTVTLTWTTSAQGVCPAVPSNTSLTVNTPATADAGGPYSTCGATAVSITATANRAGTWSGGAGTFASATSTSTTYTPPAGEIGTTVTLTWTTSAQGDCPAVPSNASLTVNTQATASAGGPYSTCTTTAVNVNATANRAGTWSGGAGTFASPTSTSTTYTPTAGEIGTTVTLTWTTTADGVCPAVPSNASLTVNALPVVTCGTYGPVCVDAADITLGGSPTGGTWSGTGVTGNSFDPSVGTQTVTYSYTDGNGCSASCSTTITVNPLPVLTCGTYGPVCVDAADITLGGSPSGGTWSGTGVTGNSFDPSAGTQTVTYSYTDGNGCSASCSTTITVNLLPVVTCGTYGPACVDAADITLGGSPTGGTWSGNGVTGNSFDPSAGMQTVTYSYTDGNGCSASCSTTINVNPLPVVTCGTYGPACSSDADITLGGSPAGGTWSGTGVTGNSFDPSAGTQTVTYNYTDGNGCSANCSTTINVTTATAWYDDTDGDGLGDPTMSVMACTQPPGYVADNSDLCPSITGTVGSACDDGNCFTVGDVLNGSCVCAGTLVPCDNWSLTINAGTNGGQISWQIVEDGGPCVLASGNGYSNGSTNNINVCVPQGNCFKLTFTDAGNNGIQGGDWKLVDNNGRRILDNVGNGGCFATTTTTPLAFCNEPASAQTVIPIHCDKENWIITDVIIASANAAVSAQWGIGDQTDDGYQFWFQSTCGTYSRRVFRNHATSGSQGPANALRASKLALGTIYTSPLPVGELLNVRVRTRVNGVNGNWGPACRFKLDPNACTITQLNSTISSPNYSCGVSGKVVGAGGNTGKIFADVVTSGGNTATNYRFQFAVPGEGYVRNVVGTNAACQLAVWQTSPLLCGTYTYEVRVQASFNGGASYCPLGPVCNVTITNNQPIYCTTPSAMAEQMDTRADNFDGGDFAMYPNPNRGDQLFVNMTGFDVTVGLVTVEIHDGFGKRAVTATLPVQDGTLNTALALPTDMAAGLYMVHVTAGELTKTERLVIQR